MNVDDYDVLVLAGDIATRSFVIPFLENLSRKDGGKSKIYVPGNHEYYGSTIEGAIANIRNNKPECVHFLNNEIEVINGQRFVGSTLWFSDGGNRNKANVEDVFWTDFRYITDLHGKAYDLHNACMDFLHSEIKQDDVVVTHHLPHKKAISPRFRNSKSNRYFQTDVNPDLFNKAGHWLFGHTHDRFDFNVQNCRLIANPLGYPGENNSYHDVVIELGN